MTLDELLLQRLADWGSVGGRQEMSVSDDQGRTVRLVAEHVDVVGCRLDEVTLTGPAVADLPARAAAVAARVTGLLEPLRPIETDAAAGVALLRSSAPVRRGEVRSYYELLLRADGSAALHRYQAPAGGRRQAVAFSLTHEALAKLVADLTAA
jgi:hypothetical protein